MAAVRVEYDAGSRTVVVDRGLWGVVLEVGQAYWQSWPPLGRWLEGTADATSNNLDFLSAIERRNDHFVFAG